jgi:cyanophycin synthetase
MLDYAHNPHSYEAIGGFVRNWPGERIGVVGGPGDRRDEDFVVLGKLAAQMFNRILVKEDDDNRGRPRGDAARLIVEGIEAAQTGVAYETILHETTAVNQALDQAPVGSLVVIFPESVARALELIEARNPLPDLGLPPNVSSQEATPSDTVIYSEAPAASQAYAQSGG